MTNNTALWIMKALKEARCEMELCTQDALWAVQAGPDSPFHIYMCDDHALKHVQHWNPSAKEIL